MSQQASWAQIGIGKVGGGLNEQLADPLMALRLGLRRHPEFIGRSSGIMQADGKTPLDYENLEDIEEMPDVVFVTVPSTENGEEAYRQISTVLAAGKMAVTAEKGALANKFVSLKRESDDFARLGVEAAVGGGTRMVSVLERYCQDKNNISQLHLALNGTLAAIFSSVAPPEGSGMSLGQAVHQAVQLDYAEPGSWSPYEVIKREAEDDIPKKISILFNRLGLSEKILSWDKLVFDLADEDISRVVEEAKIRRFIVSLYPLAALAETGPENDMIGGFQIEHENWLVVGGFRHIEKNPLFYPLANLTGPGNGFVIGLGPDETDGVYSLTGPGAGVQPTVNAMLDDYLARKHLLA